MMNCSGLKSAMIPMVSSSVLSALDRRCPTTTWRHLARQLQREVCMWQFSPWCYLYAIDGFEIELHIVLERSTSLKNVRISDHSRRGIRAILPLFLAKMPRATLSIFDCDAETLLENTITQLYEH